MRGKGRKKESLQFHAEQNVDFERQICDYIKLCEQKNSLSIAGRARRRANTGKANEQNEETNKDADSHRPCGCNAADALRLRKRAGIRSRGANAGARADGGAGTHAGAHS